MLPKARPLVEPRVGRIAAALAGVALITWVCFRLVRVNATTTGFAYLVAIMWIAARWGLTEAIVASLAAVACFNFFFFPPIGTFTIADPQNWVALIAFLATSITASQLSMQVKRRAQEATDRQRDMEKLYALSRSVLLIQPDASVPKQLAMRIAQTFGASAVALYDRDSGAIHRAGPEDFQDNQGKLKQAALQGTLFREDSTVVTAIRLGAQPIAGLAIQGVLLSDSALQSIANLVAIGLERARVQEAASKAEAARQSDELKSTLLDAVAHEFKTPLTSIKAASTSLLSNHSLQTAQQRELISVIDEEAARLSMLVTEAIHMARIEAGRVRLDREHCAACNLLEAAVQKFRTAEPDRAIELQVPPGLPPLWVDPELIELALRQILDNAIKYSPRASPVTVAAAEEGPRVVISVVDRGPGIPEEERGHIFEKFYRGRDHGARTQGAGLGLAIAREIVRAHGGEIWVDSAPGQGTMVRFSLPGPAETRA